MPINKKICILTSVHPVFDVRIFYKQAKTLINAGYNVTLIAQHDKNEIREGIKIIALLKPKNRFFRMFATTLKVFYLAKKQKANIYHLHDPELIPIGILLKLFTGAKIIYDIHENVSATILGKPWIHFVFVKKFLAKIYKLFEKTVALFFDALILAAKDVSDVKNNKTVVLRNFPLLEMTPNSTRQSANDMFSIIYIGTISRNRCLKEILQSLNHIKQAVKLYVIGESEDKSLCKELLALSKTNQKDIIQFFGRLPYKKVLQYISLANVGLVLFYPDPNNLTAVERNNKLYEYMALALPVIVSNFPAWQKFVQREKVGLAVNPFSPEEIAEAINILINDRQGARKMSNNGRKAFLERYNWENESKKLLEIYQNI